MTEKDLTGRQDFVTDLPPDRKEDPKEKAGGLLQDLPFVEGTAEDPASLADRGEDWDSYSVSEEMELRQTERMDSEGQHHVELQILHHLTLSKIQ